MKKWIATAQCLAVTVALGCAAPVLKAQTGTISSGATSVSAMALLDREQAGKIFPATVFFRGQSAPIQSRNSAGIKLNDKFVLAAMVDTSGYSTGVQEKYQAYLLTEVPLKIGDKTIPAGAYGFGFIAGDQLTLMDIGGNEVLHAPTMHDARLARPNPLQILPDTNANSARLYLGRSYVTLTPQGK